jgi:CelD/BcsL family acetyltransferase involved in cellulose biosynthesis
MKFEWITEWETIWSNKFIEEWKQWYLQAENGHPFFHPEMVKAWVDAYINVENIKPLFCIAREENSIIFFPLVLWTRNWKNAYVKMIMPVGYGVFDYLTPLYFQNTHTINWEEYWNDLVQNIDQTFSHEYDIIEFLSVDKKYISSLWKLEDICPISDISKFATLDEFLSSRKKNFRHTIKRRLKRLNEFGDISYHVVENIEEILEFLPTFLSLHKQLWPNAYKAPDFHKNIILYGMKGNVVHFSILSLNGKPISFVLGLIHNGTYFHYMSAYDLAYTNFSIGSMHIFYSFEFCISHNFHTYDLLRGNEAYKFDWTTSVKEVYQFKLVNKTIFTNLKMFLLMLKNKIQ